jgi:hypothetical protein
MVSFVRDSLMSMNHPVGTCRSGSDDASVVDPELRVHGVRVRHVAAQTNGFADGCQRPWGSSFLVLDFCEPRPYLVS